MRQSLSTPAARTANVFIADNLIGCLVAAGFCKKHAPYRNIRPAGISRSLLGTARRLQSTSSSALLAEPSDPAPENRDTQHSKTEEQENIQRRRSKWRTDDYASNGHGPPAVVKGPKHALLRRSSLPKDFNLDAESYNRAKNANTEESKLLFGLYVGVLGKVEGTTSLKVVLSNPQREAWVSPRPPSQAGTDDLETAGVSHLVSLLEQGGCTDQELFAAYRRIPSPGVSYLSARTRGRLLHRFAKPERRGRTGVFYYLTLVDDMCNASLEMSPSLWTAAIHLAGKSAITVKQEDLEAAIGVWRRMEHEGNISSSSVAFNILFDLAIKSGQFKVAERIIADMKKRKAKFSRFGRVAQIFFNGLKGNAHGVRRAYDEFVKAGEIVDTVVLNCVIASLIRSGEAKVAELMYERMKDAYKKLETSPKEKAVMYPSPSQDYTAYRKASKQLGRVLGMASYLHDKLPDHHRALQAAMPLTPDAKTFHILLSYHAHVTGDLGRFLALLAEMEGTLSIPCHGMEYILLFQGFAIHGSKRNTRWTYPRLQRAWISFLRSVRDSDAEIQTKQRTLQRKAKFTWSAESSFVEGEDSERELTPEEVDEAEEGFKDEADKIFPDSYYYAREELEDDWKYENSVYLGRTVIIACLRAFHACGGRPAVLGPIDIDFTLRRVFGKKSFRPLQRDVIQAAIEGHDVFLQAATSFGKSLCFQLPAVVAHGVTIVVSPLLSLMVDQVASLEARAIPVATINSTTPGSKRKAILADILSGHPVTRLLYVTPEFCQTESFRRSILTVHQQGELTRVAIDEAHCVSEWGHDFRPAYKALSWFRRELKDPIVPITALTATATTRVRNDIITLLGLDPSNLKKFSTSSSRPNIHYEVKYLPICAYDLTIPEDSQIDYMVSWLQAIHNRRMSRLSPPKDGPQNETSTKSPTLPPMSGIIYVPLRALCCAIASILSSCKTLNIKAVSYHAGLPTSERERIQSLWAAPHKTYVQPKNLPKTTATRNQKADPPAFYIVVATNAFGMGIDNPNTGDFANETVRLTRKRTFENLTAAEIKAQEEAKIRNTEAILRSFAKVVKYCEITDRCKHVVIREFSDDLELELARERPPPSSQIASGSKPKNLAVCDYACDHCKEGPVALGRRKNEGLKSAQLFEDGAAEDDIYTKMNLIHFVESYLGRPEGCYLPDTTPWQIGWH
ncbi:uncharacterized protein GIQ15_01399 [Arthroderma uncinatum]|uniref:uncharacterized protein n=1 Tax=Arthroderma uncinatum TaxID=74035 RepID=UPI00144A8B6A|nr:uncharacterized protein GIQ15_01399 [Arthroderma uncinatum]KAF3491882.1 hypothetical protein GIQ15_01399 [Arthroderma uncinatum]